MFGIGTGELLLIVFVALLVLGPERMPQLMRDVGKAVTDLRRTSEQLQQEFLNADKTLSADKLLDAAAKRADSTPEPALVTPPAPPDAAATQAEVTTPVEPVTPSEPDETVFDREARLARERLTDPEQAKARDERAAAEGWTIPTDEAGTSPREG